MLLMAANLRAKAVLTMSKFAEDMVQFTGVISLLYKTLLLFDKIRPNTVIEASLSPVRHSVRHST